MELPKVKTIKWLVKKKSGDIEALGFLRDHKNGFYIIGGPTGSYYSGHGEHWRDKWEEILNSGYVPRDIALKENIIKMNWRPPAINKEDRIIIDMINSGKQ